jgi:hypothetical protein
VRESLPRRFDFRGEAAAPLLPLLGVAKGKEGLLRRLYPGRERLTCPEIAAAGSLLQRGQGWAGGWLNGQRRAWLANRGRPVPEDVLPLVLAQRPAKGASHAGLGRLVQVPGLDNARLPEVRRQMARSAAELRGAYRLAARLSAATGAPVITLHNATLGGFSAWGVPGFHQQGSRRGLATTVERVADVVELPGALVAGLWEQRLEALIRPRLRWLLSALRISCALDGDPAAGPAVYERWLAKARPLLSEAEPPEMAFPFRPRQELEALLADTLALAAVERERGPEMFRLLAALWLAAKDLMDRGRLDSFVIPVADKLIASSSRGRAVGYMSAWLRLLAAAVPEARCLLFDASPHPGSPSLRYTPAALAEAGISALGLGIFSQDGTRPQNLRELLAHPGVRLFIIEPLPSDRRRYDPAWREGIGWLTAGSTLAELADPWLPGPAHGGRVLTSAGPVAGGEFFRLLMRQRLALTDGGGTREARLWRRWVGLARLR